MTAERFGPYRVGARLGRGGMGEVHEAWDTTRERAVALKRLHTTGQDDPDVKERFRRESRVAARLDSPHIVPIHDFGIIDGRMYIDMRLVRGSDLSSLIHAHGPLAPTRAVGIIEQVADALDTAHRAGIVHRDVKPTNILRADTSTGRDFVYLADFGIAHVRDASDASRLTATGAFIGTPAYMAPEQLRGSAIDPRTDVYALGAVLFEALTGRPPFLGDPASVITAHLTTTPPRPSSITNIPRELDDIILTALSKAPTGRFTTATSLAAAASTSLDRRTPRRVEQRVILTEPPQSAYRSRRNPTPRTPSAPTPPPAKATPAAPLAEVAPAKAPAMNGLWIVHDRRRDGTPVVRRPRNPRRAGLWVTVAVLSLITLFLVAGILSVQLERQGSSSQPSTTRMMTSQAPSTIGASFSQITAARMESEVTAQTGARYVICPPNLPAVVGETTTCSGTFANDSASYSVTVNRVAGNEVGFKIVRTS